MTIFRRRSKSLVDQTPILEAYTSSSSFMLGDFDNKDHVMVSAEFHHSSSHDDDDGSATSSTHYANDSHSNSNNHHNEAEESVHLNSSNNGTNDTTTSNNSSNHDEAVSSTTTEGENDPNDDDNTALGQAILNDYEVKLDDENDNVMVSVDVPPSTTADDLNVDVDDGILRVSGDVGGGGSPSQSFDFDDNDGTNLPNESNHSNDSSNNANESTRTLQSTSANIVEQSFQLDEQSLDIENVTANLCNGVLTITAPKKDVKESTLLESLPIHTNTPPPRLLANPDAFRVIIDVPGVPAQDIYANYTNGKLRVSANRHFGRVRSFKRTIQIDAQKFDVDRLAAYLYNGRFTVFVPPKTQNQKCVSRTIRIRTIESIESSSSMEKKSQKDQRAAAGKARTSPASSMNVLVEHDDDGSDSSSIPTEVTAEMNK